MLVLQLMPRVNGAGRERGVFHENRAPAGTRRPNRTRWISTPKTPRPSHGELPTQRLHLRRCAERRCAGPVQELHGRRRCSRFLQRRPHAEVAQTEAMLAKWCDTAWDTRGEPFSWVIGTRETDEPIGVFVVIPDGHKTEIHYGIDKRFWGQGLAAEAGAAAIAELWRTSPVQRIWTVCDVDNIGSQRVLEKLGLRHEGILSKWLVLPAFGPEARDCQVLRRDPKPRRSDGAGGSLKQDQDNTNIPGKMRQPPDSNATLNSRLHAPRLDLEPLDASLAPALFKRALFTLALRLRSRRSP